MPKHSRFPTGHSRPAVCTTDGPPPPTPEPQRLEDLDRPYSVYPSVPLQFTAHPENAIHGLGIRHVRPYALFAFENWASQNINDYYALFLGDKLFDGVVTDLTQPRHNLAIPEEKVPIGEVLGSGLVRRAGSGNESTSPPERYLIKINRPGGIDTDPGNEWHTGLVMAVEGFAYGSTIGAGDVAAGVWCLIYLYQYIRQNDVIELSWDGIFILHTVSPAEAAGTGPIRVFVPKSVIDKGGQQGELTLRFRVRDVVENFSGEKYQYSKPYLLKAELDPSLLEAPTFLVDGAVLESRQIDFDTQSGAIFEVIAYTARSVPTPNPRHKIIVTLFGTLADGTPQTFVQAPETDKNLGFTYISIDASIISQLVGGSFRVSFRWETDAGVFLGQSGSITITVVGTPVLMPPPSVSPIELGLIPAGQNITVTIPVYEPHNPGWLEELKITHVPAGGGEAIIYRKEQLAGAQGGTYTVTAAELAPFTGKGHTTIHYETNDGAVHLLGGNALAIRQSAMLGVQIGERTVDMPEPRLQGAIGNNVDPTDVPGNEVLVTFTFLNTVAGDTLHWSCIGSGPGGSASGSLEINGATQGKELPYPVSRDILDKNNNGSLRISYSLERPGPPRVVLRSEVLALTVGKGVTLDRPIIEGASLHPDRLNPLAALAGTWVTIKFRPMLATDKSLLEWLSSDGIGSDAIQVQGNPDTHEVRAFISPEIIAKGIREGGNRISVQYHFTRGTFPYASEIVDLELLPLTGLPTPFIQGVGDAADLTLSQLVIGARTLTPVWPFIHPDSRVWMEYQGIYNNGDAYHEMTYISHRLGEVDAIGGLQPPTPIESLQRLMDGSTLTIQLWVGFGQSLSKALAVAFPTRTYNVRVDYFRDLTDFYNFNWNGWVNSVNGKGALTIEGAENVIWQATKNSFEAIEPGVQKTFVDLKANTQYEVSFYCKTTGSTSQTTAKISFGNTTVTRAVAPDRNWDRLSHTFTTPATPPTQAHQVRITFSINATSTFSLDQIQIREMPRMQFVQPAN
ncbi:MULTISPECIES: hypothetical protein [Pseudomonas]|jgi:hypothetical protein|uniref:hypothetical protein n=1 Tax=Pseudomonas TaxID=286 RepID=UPI00132F142A|nr:MULTISPECIES: hypothetical protein [Pseudomonas]NMZ33649.1 hypothetical protein [Pseudomonas proteolytica]QHG23500.1 hypothetical protein GDV60_11730 [Pseudomonas sp. DTU12.1]